MKINLKFIDNVGVYSTPTFDIADNDDLYITFDLSGIKSKMGVFKAILELNGKQEKYVGIEHGKTIVVEGKWLREAGAGELKTQLMQFSLAGNVEINKGAYHIEPLVITDMQGGGFTATAVFSDALARLSTVEETVENTEKQFEETLKENAELRKVLVEEIESAKRQLAALKKFAHDCISAIPYINDLKIEEE